MPLSLFAKTLMGPKKRISKTLRLYLGPILIGISNLKARIVKIWQELLNFFFSPNLIFHSSMSFKNPSIFNIIRWVAGSMRQTTHRPSVWCSKYFFFHNFLQNYLQKLFQFISLFSYKFKKIKILSFEWPKSIRNYEKK